ncbi:MAG: conjugal transfer protein TrbF [Pseudomonadota bacterium]|nr:conjugal transfer protein TrbF [Pseudomonadota bacterium]
MKFKRSQLHYGQTETPVTPYQKAQQVWDERIGSARMQARNWRLMAFGCLGLVGGLCLQLAVLSTTSRVTPYVVEVERGGSVRAVAPAVENYDPSDAQIAAELARFIQYVREVSTDPVVVKQNWLKAYDYATDRATQTLNNYARENDPFAKIGQRSVSVEITSVVRASPSSFQVRWREKAFENGSAAGLQSFTGVLTIVTKSPRDAATLRANPLGIYVNAINWSRELDPISSSQPHDNSGATK